MSYIQHLVDTHPFTVAQSIETRGKTIQLPDKVTGIICEANFIRGGAGTTCKVFIQTTLDSVDGLWTDIMCFHFTTSSLRAIMAVQIGVAIATPVTPVVGALADNTSVNGFIGNRLRAQIVTTGTYTGTSTVDILARIAHD